MKTIQLSTIICYSLLGLILAASLILRMAIPWDQVFAGNWVKLTDNDAYFYARLLDNISRHFPIIGNPDPYYTFDTAYYIAGQPMFHVYLMGFFAWLFGAGAPAQHTVDLVAACFPAVAGALLVIPVFFIGRRLFNRWAGLVAAAVIALLPGEFLIRTLLGNCDSHVLEILLTTLFMLFLILAVSEGRDLRLPDALQKDRRRLILTGVYSVLAGLCLCMYLLAWQGALFFVFIAFLWMMLQFAADHLYGRPTVYLGLTGAIVFLTALLTALLARAGLMAILSLAVASVAPPLLAALAWFSGRYRLNPGYYPMMMLAAGVAGLLTIYFASPGTLKNMFDMVSLFFSWRIGTDTAEMQPLLIEQGRFTLALAWGNFTAASLMALVALGIVLYRGALKAEPGMLLLAVWTLLTLLSALAMRRFAYYLAINVAVLAGYTGWLMLYVCGLREDGLPGTARAPAPKAAGRKGRRQQKAVPGYNRAYLATGLIAVAFLVIYPNTGPLPGGDKPFFDVARRALYTPPDGWCQAMDWLRNETPEPFGKADYYFANYAKNATGGTPTPAYSVVCWWDYGYWVSRMGHRVPYSNPGTAAQRGEQRLYLAQDEAAVAGATAGAVAGATAGAEAIRGARYVITDNYMVDWQKGFPAIAFAAQEPASKYFEMYYRRQGERLSPTLLYYPEYYRCLAVRLHCFDAKAYSPAETAVISWESRTGQDGKANKEITALKTFRGYADAQAFIAAQQSGNWRIVGKDPCTSPVPLEKLSHYTPAYASEQKAAAGTAELPAVKIFEYKP